MAIFKRHYTKGGMIKVEELNALVEEVIRLGKITGNNGIDVISNAGGIQIRGISTSTSGTIDVIEGQLAGDLGTNDDDNATLNIYTYSDSSTVTGWGPTSSDPTSQTVYNRSGIALASGAWALAIKINGIYRVVAGNCNFVTGASTGFAFDPKNPPALVGKDLPIDKRMWNDKVQGYVPLPEGFNKGIRPILPPGTDR